MLHKMTNNICTTPHSDDEITKTKKLNICESHLFELKERKKKIQMSDSISQNTLISPLPDDVNFVYINICRDNLKPIS